MYQKHLICVLFVFLAMCAFGEIADRKSHSVIEIGEDSLSGSATFSTSELNGLLSWDEDEDGVLSEFEFAAAREDLESLGEMFFSLEVHGNSQQARNVRATFAPTHPEVAVLTFNFPIRRQFLADGFDVVFDAYDLFEEGHQHRLVVQDLDGSVLLSDDFEVHFGEELTSAGEKAAVKSESDSPPKLPAPVGVAVMSPPTSINGNLPKGMVHALMGFAVAVGLGVVWTYSRRRQKA